MALTTAASFMQFSGFDISDSITGTADRSEEHTSELQSH